MGRWSRLLPGLALKSGIAPRSGVAGEVPAPHKKLAIPASALAEAKDASRYAS